MMSQLLLPESLIINRNELESKPEQEIDQFFLYKFQTIANQLINHFCIVKDSDGISPRIVYHFMELEFYFCSPEHPDVITYPRIAKAGDWFFHESGVDICFESNVELNSETGKVVSDSNSYGFGGILIRALTKESESGEITFITGPLNCCYELFDRFSAFKKPCNFPIIREEDNARKSSVSSCGRYFNFSTSIHNKLKAIYNKHWDSQNEIDNEAEQQFTNYLNRKYCFFDEDAFNLFAKSKHKRYDSPSNDTSKAIRLRVKI